MCRKAQGSAFRSRAAVKSAEFEFVQGEDLITFYESSPGNHRGFCRVCGSPILSKYDNRPNNYGLPLGALDDDPGIQPKLHVYVANKAPWYTITDDLPRHRQLERPQTQRDGAGWAKHAAGYAIPVTPVITLQARKA